MNLKIEKHFLHCSYSKFLALYRCSVSNLVQSYVKTMLFWHLAFTLTNRSVAVIVGITIIITFTIALTILFSMVIFIRSRSISNGGIGTSIYKIISIFIITSSSIVLSAIANCYVGSNWESGMFRNLSFFLFCKNISHSFYHSSTLLPFFTTGKWFCF